MIFFQQKYHKKSKKSENICILHTGNHMLPFLERFVKRRKPCLHIFPCLQVLIGLDAALLHNASLVQVNGLLEIEMHLRP